jgi:hypothetical protein
VKKIVTILFVLGLFGTASAEFSKVGSAGAQFLKIGVGSKYQGMGEAAVAVTNDVYATYWNPAGLVGVENSSIGFTNVNWLLDIDLNFVAIAKRFEDIGVFGASVTVLSMDEQEINTFEQQDGTGDTYAASSYAIGLTYARQLTARFAFGASVKYLQEKIHLEESQGFAFDFGTMLYTGFESLRLGMSISNMGPEMKFSGPSLDVSYDDQNGQGANSPVGAQLKTTPYDLPLVFRVGLAYDLEISPSSALLLAAELKHPNDNMQQGAVGAELGFSEKYFLRGGYKLNYDEETFSFGGGLTTPVTGDVKLVVDYSWQDFGRLESAQRFSVGFTF